MLREPTLPSSKHTYNGACDDKRQMRPHAPVDGLVIVFVLSERGIEGLNVGNRGEVM
jgi:hypothetical protein